MVNQDLVKFIKEARRRGFEDYEIREPLLKQGWSDDLVEEAFSYIDVKTSRNNKGKIGIKVYIDSKVYAVVEKRAKRNMFTVEEQVVDIIRRSSVNTSVKKFEGEKIDDLLVSIFSRRKRNKK